MCRHCERCSRRILQAPRFGRVLVSSGWVMSRLMGVRIVVIAQRGAGPPESLPSPVSPVATRARGKRIRSMRHGSESR